MSVTEAIAVRELLLDSPAFGIDEIGQIETAIAADQCQEVLRVVSELARKLNESEPAHRDVLAFGVTSYLLARHEIATQWLSRLSGDGLAEYYNGMAFIALERYEEAVKSLAQAGSHGHDPVHCMLISAGAVRLSGRLDESEQMLRGTAPEGARRAEYSYQMGCILADRGDTYGAIEYFERAADMDSGHSGSLFRLANQNNSLGNDREAIKLYERSLAKPPLFLGALMNLGLLYEDSEHYRAAAFCFRRVLEIFPGHARATLYLRDIEASTDMYYDEEAVRRSRELDQVLYTPIADFELSARSRNCLERAGIHTLGDLTETTERDLLAGKNFGDTSLKEIKSILESRGLRLGQSLAPETPVTYEAPKDLSPQEQALHEKPVADLELSVRSRKCLARLGITSIGGLISKSADELLGIRNFGVTSLNEIRAQLSNAGLALRND